MNRKRGKREDWRRGEKRIGGGVDGDGERGGNGGGGEVVSPQGGCGARRTPH